MRASPPACRAQLREQLRKEMIDRLENFERLAKLQDREPQDSLEKSALQVINTCQTLGLVPVPADGTAVLDGEPSRYIDTLGRECVAEEQLTVGTPDETIQLVMEKLLMELDDYNESQQETRSGSREAGVDPAEAACLSRTQLGQCPTDECVAMVGATNDSDVDTFENAVTSSNDKSVDKVTHANDHNSNTGAEKLRRADNGDNKELKTVCLPGPKLHLDRMRRLQQEIEVQEKARATLDAEREKLVEGVNRQRLAAMRSFVRPSFGSRQERAATEVLKDYDNKIEKINKDILEKRNLYRKYAVIASEMRGTGLREDALDKMCRTAVTEGDCADMKGDDGKTCTIFDIDPVKNWSARDMSTDEKIFGTNDPEAQKKAKKQRLVGEDESHGGVADTTQCRHPEAVRARSSDWAAAQLAGGGWNGGDDRKLDTEKPFISPANLQRLSELNTALLNAAFFISPEAKISENREHIGTLARQTEELAEHLLAFYTFMRTKKSDKTHAELLYGADPTAAQELQLICLAAGNGKN